MHALWPHGRVSGYASLTGLMHTGHSSSCSSSSSSTITSALPTPAPAAAAPVGRAAEPSIARSTRAMLPPILLRSAAGDSTSRPAVLAGAADELPPDPPLDCELLPALVVCDSTSRPAVLAGAADELPAVLAGAALVVAATSSDTVGNAALPDPPG